MPARLRSARRATATVFLLGGALLGVWATQVPLLKARLELPPATLGAALLCLALGACASMPLSGRIAARLGAGGAIRLGVLLACPALPVAATAPGLVVLCLALAVFGLGIGITDVAMNAHAVAVEQALGRPVLSRLHAMWSLGGLAGSAGGAALLAVLSPGAQVALAAAMAAAGMLGVTGAMLPSVPTGGEAPGRRPWRDGGLLLLGVLMAGAFMAEGAVLDWSGIFLLGTRGLAPALAAMGYAAFSAAMVGMRLAGDAIRVRLGAAGMLGLTVLGLPGMALALLAPGQVAPLAGFALVGVSVANVAPVLFALAGRRGTSPAACVAVAASIGYAGVLGGPPLLGLVAQAGSVGGALWLVGGLCGAVGVLGALVGRGRGGGEEGQGSALDPLGVAPPDLRSVGAGSPR